MNAHRYGAPVFRVGHLAAPKLIGLTDPAPSPALRDETLNVLEAQGTYALTAAYRLAGVRLATVKFAPNGDGTHTARFVPSEPLPNRGARPQLKYMHAAIRRDIGGEKFDAIALALGYTEKSSDRSAQRAVREGRKLWRSLPAWPWCCFEHGRPPRDWLAIGATVSISEALDSWSPRDPRPLDALAIEIEAVTRT